MIDDKAAPPHDFGKLRREQAESDRYTASAEAARRNALAPPAPVEAADRDNRARLLREMAKAALPPAPPAEPFVHSTTERFSDRMVTTRYRRDGSKVTHETKIC